MTRLCAAALFLMCVAAVAQSAPAVHRDELQVGVRFIGTEANSPPGSCGCFWLRGAGVDAALPVAGRFSAAVELSGTTTARVPGTSRGLSVMTLMAGPRYSVPFGRHVMVRTQGLFGVARGFDADFVVGSQKADTASVFAMAFGGAVEVPVSRSIALRALQVEYLQTNLPNGADNRQRNVRLGAGVVFRVKVPKGR